MHWVRNGLKTDGWGVLSHFQSAGKGQRHRNWQSAAGKSILLTVVAGDLHISTDKLFSISRAISLGVAQVLDEYFEGTIHIKWPNDLFWNDKKAGGILIEPILRAQTCHTAIIGIGINVHQREFTNDIQHAISLFMATGKEFSIRSMAKQIQSKVAEALAFERAYPAKCMELYLDRLYRKGCLTSFILDETVTKRVVKGVTESGELILFNPHTGLEDSFKHSEVRWLLSTDC
jgi:BirA family biotin operon repressor/biotin-[acetyl-CoA-carboxylase] ligase